MNIITFGNFSIYSGLEFSIHACADLKEKGSQFYYTIYTNDTNNEMILFSIYDMKLENEVTVKSIHDLQLSKNSIILFPNTNTDKDTVKMITEYYPNDLHTLASDVFKDAFSSYKNISFFESWSHQSIVEAILEKINR